MKDNLKIENLGVKVEGKLIVSGVNLELKAGEVQVLMGPNGSGKSTLANALMGHPKYQIESGRIILGSKDLTKLSSDERARAGLFLSLQHPPEISGVTIMNFLRLALNSISKKKYSVIEFDRLLRAKMAELKIDYGFAGRYLNEGFSGGEKKKSEILQLAILEPKFAILDETDSGLDVDALKIVIAGIKKLISPKRGFLIITHNYKILKYLTPDRVHVMIGGRIVKSGGADLARRVEKSGYGFLEK